MNTVARILSVVACVGLVSTGAALAADAKPVDLQVGDPAPAFSAHDDSGEIWSSADAVGTKIVVVYFYPADMTGGCTKQACGFRDDYGSLTERGVEVVGVSGDSVRNHQLFKKAYDLNFPLLADVDGSVARVFGVPMRDGGAIDRTIDGKDETLVRGVTTARWTFVIDLDGRIAHKDSGVNAAEDSKKVLEVVASLQDKAVDLKVGDNAPEFATHDDQGNLWKSSDVVGKEILVVYFYPADMTGGCTRQACGFRDDLSTLSAKGVRVVGVSGDSVRNHQLFKQAYDLNFPLLADVDGSVARKFGVAMRPGGSIQRTIDGKDVTLTRGVTTMRWTFVVDRDGKIAYKNTKVDAANDSKAVQQVIARLAGA